MGDTANSPLKLSFEIYALTNMGREILTLASIPVDMDYAKKISDKAISLGAEEVQIGNLHPNGQEIMWPQTIATKHSI